MVGSGDRMVNKKSVKMGRDFRFINLRIKHLPGMKISAAITLANKIHKALHSRCLQTADKKNNKTENFEKPLTEKLVSSF